MRQLKVLEPADFERLLAWLDPNPDRAGQLYESIRWRLVAILASRGCHVPEDSADEVIDRVARRVKDIEANYTGDKAIYFLGVMNNVHHEYLRRPQLPKLVTASNDEVEVKEQTYVCLDRCLARLAPHAREIIEQYYAADKQARISLRKRIAAKFGLTSNNLRLRALRIRAKLHTCIEQCMETSETRP
jgi:DNA-directed RNA polymerase specialized sigma24 family protein